MEQWWGEYVIKIQWLKTQIKSWENIKTRTIKDLEISWNNLDLSTIFNID